MGTGGTVITALQTAQIGLGTLVPNLTDILLIREVVQLLYVDGGITITGSLGTLDGSITNNLTVGSLNVTGIATISGEA